MDKVTQSNAASAEESAAAAEELNSQAVVMKQAVSELTHLVGGGGSQASRPTAAATNGSRAKSGGSVTPAIPAAAKSLNGHGHPPAATGSELARRRDEIPLDGDFKDF
jgi:hypothetical protein